MRHIVYSRRRTAERSEAAVDVNYRHYHDNIVELNAVDIFVKIVDCHVFIINRASRGGFNRRIIEKSSGHFLTAGRRRPFFRPANGQFFIAT
jgi:hypothetical protein